MKIVTTVKIVFITFFCASLWLAEVSASELKAEITIASNYLFRGLTQTMDQAVVQGGVQYRHRSGIVAGLKIANVDFRPGAGKQRKNMYTDNENIHSLAYERTVSNIDFEIGFTNYEYPSGGGPRFHEINGGIQFKGFSLRLNFDPEHKNYYSEGAFEAAINEKLSWRVHLGHYTLDDPKALRKSRGFDDYSDISIGFRSKLPSGFVWGIDFTETDLDTDNGDEYSRFVISIHNSFDLFGISN